MGKMYKTDLHLFNLEPTLSINICKWWNIPFENFNPIMIGWATHIATKDKAGKFEFMGEKMTFVFGS